MNLFLTLAFLFFIGSVIGWVLELLYRNLTARDRKKWINPGFCTGPYLPIYGGGLCILFLIAQLEEKHFLSDPFWNKALMFVFAALAMTALEYVVGLLSLRYTSVRLWDYSDQWGNIQGIICPQFSLIWAVLSAVYYFFIHPHILGALGWLSRNLAFSFFIGLFFGVFFMDVAHSVQLVAKLKAFAEENDVVVRYEHLKARIRLANRSHFFRAFHTDRPLQEHLREMGGELEKRTRKRR